MVSSFIVILESFKFVYRVNCVDIMPNMPKSSLKYAAPEIGIKDPINGQKLHDHMN